MECAGRQAELVKAWTGEDGVAHKSVFMLLAERYLSTDYAPDAVAERTGVARPPSARFAAELAHTAFEEEITH